MFDCREIQPPGNAVGRHLTLERDIVEMYEYFTPVCAQCLAVNFVVEIFWTLACRTSDICNSLAPAESIKASTVTMLHSWPPTHSQASMCTFTHTHKHMLSHTGRQWHTDKDTHSHVQDTRPFLKYVHSSHSNEILGSFLGSVPSWTRSLVTLVRPCSSLIHFMFLQRSADIMLSSLLTDVRLQYFPGFTDTRAGQKLDF